jgi:hypothetical protein
VLEYMASAARVGYPFAKWDAAAPKDDGS